MKKWLFNRLSCALLGSIVALPIIPNRNIVIAQSQTSALAYLNGTWEGSYRCLQGLVKLKLDIKVNNEEDIDAIFSFSEHPNNPGTPSGQFKMKGRYTVARTSGATGILDLDATNWIQKPRGYKTVDLYGNIAASKDTILGAVQSTGCTKFKVSKLGTQKSSPIIGSTESSVSTQSVYQDKIWPSIKTYVPNTGNKKSLICVFSKTRNLAPYNILLEELYRESFGDGSAEIVRKFLNKNSHDFTYQFHMQAMSNGSVRINALDTRDKVINHNYVVDFYPNEKYGFITYGRLPRTSKSQEQILHIYKIYLPGALQRRCIQNFQHLER
jgi:hypothetical protein